MKCHDHAQVHYSLISSIDPTFLKLTPVDNEIYKKFKDEFPNVNLAMINEDEMKSEAGKKVWREFCESFKGTVEDYNFGTLLRLDPTADYNPENTILVPRIQFLAIEIARNREGHNNSLRHKKLEEQEAAKKEETS